METTSSYEKMPVLFIGHGSPMNAVENNESTKGWKKIAAAIPRPSAILCISAHWVAKGTRVSTLEEPKIIYDFYGFPKELYDVKYKTKGDPANARKTLDLLENIAKEDSRWGIDHGAWSVLHVMYPKADIPVYQMSIDENATPSDLFAIGKKLKPLRENNVLIVGSGNVVHNLRMLDYSMKDGFEWARTFQNHVTERILQRDFESVLQYEKTGYKSQLSVPTSEHLCPLFYILGAVSVKDRLTIYNKFYVAGSLSMTSYLFY